MNEKRKLSEEEINEALYLNREKDECLIRCDKPLKRVLALVRERTSASTGYIQKCTDDCTALNPMREDELGRVQCFKTCFTDTIDMMVKDEEKLLRELQKKKRSFYQDL